MDALIYLDHAASTPLLPQAFAAMEPFLRTRWGNAASLHSAGRESRRAVEFARREVATWLRCEVDEVVFTSGGTDSDITALTGAWLAAREEGRTHIVTTAVEHHAVLEACEFLQNLGARVTLVSPRRDGTVSAEDVVAALTGDTGVVSVMTVNNETGAVNSIGDISRAVRAVAGARVMFHSDMVQTTALCPHRTIGDSVHLASFSGHKLHGPQGGGVLFVRRGCRWQPPVAAGDSHRQRQAGTENVSAIAGLGAAVAWQMSAQRAHWRQLDAVRQEFLDGLRNLPDVHCNSPAAASPAIVNLSFAGVKADRLLMRLDLAGVAASAGSACTAGSLQPSHVLRAMGCTADQTATAVRFSFSPLTDVADVRLAAATVRDCVLALRSGTTRVQS